MFRRRIFAYNFLSVFDDRKRVDLLVGEKRSSTLKVVGYFEQVIQPDPEDLVVVNVPWEIIRTASIELPPMKNEVDRRKLAEIEIRRLFDIGVEQIEVGILPSFGDRAFALFVETEEFQRFLGSTGLSIEPDVAFPTILSELLVVARLPGYWAYFVLGKTVSGTVLTFNEGVLNLRISEMTGDDIDKIVQDETGFSLLEIETTGNEELLSAARRIVESLAMEIVSAIEREVIITVNTTETIKLTPDQLEGLVVVCDSTLLSEAILNYSVEHEVFRRRVSQPVLRFRLRKRYPHASVGLLYRGGLELGKVKSLRA